MVAILFAAPVAANGCANVAGLSSPDTSAAAQHCIDGIKDDDEEDIDCGGKDCLACGNAPCTSSGECESNACENDACKVPTCGDGVFDGYESWLDCGDPRGATVQCPLCSNGTHCFNGCNCASAYCDPTSHTCESAPGSTFNCDYCKDGVLDGTETDVDCGGGMTCPACPSGKRCAISTDCVSMKCSGGICG